MPRLDVATRNIVIGRQEAGESQNAVAARYNVHRSTMSRLWQCYQQSGSTSGPPRITYPVQDRYIRVFQLRNRTVIASQTASNIPGLRMISAQTVRNRLREYGIHTRRPYVGAVLKRQHRRARVRWGSAVRIWDLANWRRVWFSDESVFMFERRDGRVRVYWRRNEQFATNYVVEVDNYDGGSVMVCGAISYARKTQLVPIQGKLNAAFYRDEILFSHTYWLQSMFSRFSSRIMPDHILHV
jgi:transposase